MKRGVKQRSPYRSLGLGGLCREPSAGNGVHARGAHVVVAVPHGGPNDVEGLGCEALVECFQQFRGVFEDLDCAVALSAHERPDECEHHRLSLGVVGPDTDLPNRFPYAVEWLRFPCGELDTEYVEDPIQ
ncbi:hypothetical protein SY89_03481 [Halolamina pelagica]|uniref:Uncharacterized protein n=1 Tax=Halolamina pelagica TaxID=699431 RepID=A0A0P7HXY7_9EURY|nr:hypothetical protein [Halolamina pelagica]KPN29247.1 hypothetical protein SY89_03481 [Halolamina pelagica]